MKKIFLAVALTFSLNAQADDKYADCVVVGEMATDFMTMMQNGDTYSQAFKKVSGNYTSDAGDDSGNKFAIWMLDRAYQTKSVMQYKKDKIEAVKEFEREMIKICITMIDRRK